MTKYKSKERIVEAYQHTPNPNNDTASYPQWFIDLIVNEVIRPMPDGSVHVTPVEGGAIMPLPVGYWLIREVNGDAENLSVVAPDVFEATYEEV